MVFMKILLILPLFTIILFGLLHNTHAQEISSPLTEQKTMTELNSIIATLLQQERYEESLFYLDKILETHPNDKNALLNKGSALSKIDRSEEAISFYDRLLAIEPENIKALTSKAAALVYINQKQDALELFDKALSFDEDNEKIATARAQLLTLIPQESTHTSYNPDAEYDINFRVTARTPSGELISVVETAYGNYLPVQSVTDYVFYDIFESELVEINNQKYEMARYSESYTTDTENIGNFYFDVVMYGHHVHVFEVFPPHIGIEPNDVLYVAWTIMKKFT